MFRPVMPQMEMPPTPLNSSGKSPPTRTQSWLSTTQMHPIRFECSFSLHQSEHCHGFLLNGYIQSLGLKVYSISANQNAHYKNNFKKCLFVKVKVTEIFDVTQTDPSLLIADEQGVDYR